MTDGTQRPHFALCIGFVQIDGDKFLVEARGGAEIEIEDVSVGKHQLALAASPHAHRADWTLWSIKEKNTA